MSYMIDPLAKPEWSPVDPDIQEAVVGLLMPVVVRGTTATEKVGFNATMAALEDFLQEKGPAVAAVFVARSDLSSIECLPLALACTAASVKLVALPKGSVERLQEGVIAIIEGSSENGVLNLVENVTPPKLDWVYKAAQMAKNKKNNKANKKT